MTTTRRPTRDAGQAVILVLPAVALAAMLAVGAARAGVTVADRARAQAAADAAALAGVSGGPAAATRLAAANGATLTSFSVSGDALVTTVAVTVRVGDVAATARATNGP